MFNIRDYKIGSRLIMTTVGALALMVAFVGIALFNLSNINDKVDSLANGNIKKREFAGEMRIRNLVIASSIRSAIIYEERAKQNAEREKVHSEFAKYLEVEKKIEASLAGEKEKVLFAELVATRGEADAAVKQMVDKDLQGLSSGASQKVSFSR